MRESLCLVAAVALGRATACSSGGDSQVVTAATGSDATTPPPDLTTTTRKVVTTTTTTFPAGAVRLTIRNGFVKKMDLTTPPATAS